MPTKLDYFNVQSLQRGKYREYWVSSAKDHNEGTAIVQKTLEFMKNHNAAAVSTRFFGSRSDITEALRFIEKQAKHTLSPICLIQEDLTDRAPFNIQVYAVSGLNVKPLYFEDQLVGRQFEDDYVKYYILDILSDDRQPSKYDHTKSIFEKTHTVLQSFGADFSDVIRTWLFAQDILSWYDQLNSARNRFFQRHGIYNKLVPASTGVGVMNINDKALVANVLAVKPRTSKVTIQTADSPLQNSALHYKSSFSRAVKLTTPDTDRLYISGTASIDKAGNTVFVNDTFAQIEKTMQVVQAILNDTAADWADVVSSLAYFKRREDFGLFDDYCRANEIELPHIKIQADICRDDLLFELELDAIRKNTI